MNPTEATQQPAAQKAGIAKRFFSRAGTTLGVQFKPGPEAPVVVSEKPFSDVPTSPTSSTPEVVPVVEPATTVPAETSSAPEPRQPSAPLIKEFPDPVAPPEFPSSTPVSMPIQPLESFPIAPTPPKQVTPMEQPKPEGPSQPTIIAQETQEASVEEIPEDQVATELISKDPEKFIKDGVLDFTALKAAKEAKLISDNPKAQGLVDQLHKAGVKNPEVISKLVQPILAKAA